jgi:hypothetical protein
MRELFSTEHNNVGGKKIFIISAKSKRTKQQDIILKVENLLKKGPLN